MRKVRFWGLLCCLGLVSVWMSDARAATIPGWLDDAITEWNEEHVDTPLVFVDIKDSYVWYMVSQSAESKSKTVRESVYGLIREHSYRVADDEEKVTVGRPPSPTAPYKEKKCWSRSFVRDIHALENEAPVGSSGRSSRNGQKQRMLTSLICDDRPYWFAGFRVLE